MPTLSYSKSKDFETAIAKASGFKPPAVSNDKNLFRNYSEAIERFNGIANGLHILCKEHLAFDFKVPTVPLMGAEEAAKPYPDTLALAQYNMSEAYRELHKNMDVPQIGRIHWTDDETCEYTYFDVDVQKTWEEIKTRRLSFTHQLVNAKEHRINNCPVDLPKKAKQIIKAIPEALHREVRIVTGTLVMEDSKVVSENTELTALGRLAKQVFAFDPAIVVGEFCFYGWK